MWVDVGQTFGYELLGGEIGPGGGEPRGNRVSSVVTEFRRIADVSGESIMKKRGPETSLGCQDKPA